jgi:hypothetical protein
VGGKVFFVGAGFSMAISSEMPSLAELGRLVRAALDARGRSLPAEVDRLGDDVELWLTYLGEEQPWLDPAVNLRHRAAFIDVASSIREVLWERQLAVVAHSAPPAWLTTLVDYWLNNSSVVISLNYDVLVELAFKERLPGHEHYLPFLYRLPLAPLGARSGGSVGSGARIAPIFDLLKLHGSLSWYWSGPEAGPNDVIYQMGLKGGWSVDGTGSIYDDELELLTDDKVPLVVPPTASKSRYYGNTALAVQWVRVGQALAEADELVIIGYSLPTSDTMIRALLASSFTDGIVIPVNTQRDAFEAAKSVFAPSDPMVTVTDQCIATPGGMDDFVSAYCS